MIYFETLGNMKENLLFRLGRINTPLLILLTIIFNLIISVIFFFISGKLQYSINANFLSFESLNEEIFVALIFTPFVETTLYQYSMVSIILFLSQLIFKKEYIILAIILPSIFLAGSHLYNYINVANSLIAGIAFNFFYIIVMLRKQNAFICTVIVHSLYNLCVFALMHI